MPLLQIPIFLSHCKFLITGFLGRPRLQGARRYTPRFWVTASPATPTTSPPEGTTARGRPKPWCQPQGKLSPIKTILLFQILFSTSTSFNFYKSIGVTWLNLWEIGMRFEKENKFWRDFEQDCFIFWRIRLEAFFKLSIGTLFSLICFFKTLGNWKISKIIFV